MSPPTDSHGPTEDMTRTLLGPHNSKASYSGDFSPAGLSAPISGRWGTNLRPFGKNELFLSEPRYDLAQRQRHRGKEKQMICLIITTRDITNLTVTALPAHFMPLARGLYTSKRQDSAMGLSLEDLVVLCHEGQIRIFKCIKPHLAPSMKLEGHPITHRPSIKACSQKIDIRSHFENCPPCFCKLDAVVTR